MRLIESIADLKTWRKNVTGSVGFVPTMGALHAGHAELLKRMRERVDVAVLSIFVNPTQFGPNEDLAKYPRTLESDLVLARECGVDLVFFPQTQEIYPKDFSTCVEETQVSQPLCGHFRPGHFKGVTTIVLKLFNLVQPELAFFGLKDAQQFFVLSRMVKDLNMNVMLEGIATVREPDGLALSSRNRYLSPSARAKAPRLYALLQECAKQIQSSPQITKEILSEVKIRMQSEGFEVQYLDFLKTPDLSKFESEKTFPDHETYILAVAAYLEGTRLIDNILLNPPSSSEFKNKR